MASVESAISSLVASEYFIPWCPMAIHQHQTPIAGNSTERRRQHIHRLSPPRQSDAGEHGRAQSRWRNLPPDKRFSILPGGNPWHRIKNDAALFFQSFLTKSLRIFYPFHVILLSLFYCTCIFTLHKPKPRYAGHNHEIYALSFCNGSRHTPRNACQ